MSADDITPSIRLAQPFWFWGATVILLAPLVTLIVHRALSHGEPPHANAVSVTDLQRERQQAQTAALALQESQRLLDAGQAEASLEPIRRALAADPRNAAAYNNLCVAHGLLKHRSAAVAACTQAIELEPSNERARNNLRWVTGLPEQAAP